MTTILLTPDTTQNEEPYVCLTFGPGVAQVDRDEVRSLCHGYGLSCGYGPGKLRDAVNAAHRLARRLRHLGWSVSVEGEDYSRAATGTAGGPREPATGQEDS